MDGRTHYEGCEEVHADRAREKLADARASLAALQRERDGLLMERDGAYGQRNMLVGALSKVFPSWLREDPREPMWPVVIVQLPTGQVSWHITRVERYAVFAHLEPGEVAWDGHDDIEKWRRVCALASAPVTEATPDLRALCESVADNAIAEVLIALGAKESSATYGRDDGKIHFSAVGNADEFPNPTYIDSRAIASRVLAEWEREHRAVLSEPGGDR